MPVKVERKTSEPALHTSHPFERLRHEVDRLFDDFDPGIWHWPVRRAPFAAEPLRRRELTLGRTPAVDVIEAFFKKGALTVTVQKAPKPRKRKRRSG